MAARGNILMSSAGRRAGLIACMRESIERRGEPRHIFATDCSPSAPAMFLADAAFPVPPCAHPEFVDTVLALCREHEIALIVPTIDTELPVYAQAAARFQKTGVAVAVSSAETVEVCRDKRRTHAWLLENGFPTVRQTNAETALAERAAWPLPLIAKPYNGSSAVGVRRVETLRELEAVAERSGGVVIQELARGREFTVNVYVNRQGECVCAVPHWRIEVRGGEVSKAVTVKDARLVALGRAVAEALPGAWGALNMQCFVDERDGIRVIEMNARFGGGYPLAHRAGARFTDWLLAEVAGEHPAACRDWTDDLAMLRYDDAIYTAGSGVRR